MVEGVKVILSQSALLFAFASGTTFGSACGAAQEQQHNGDGESTAAPAADAPEANGLPDALPAHEEQLPSAVHQVSIIWSCCACAAYNSTHDQSSEGAGLPETPPYVSSRALTMLCNRCRT